MDTGQLGKTNDECVGMTEIFERELQKRKHTLDCFMRGEYPQWMIEMGMPKKFSFPLSAEYALIHLEEIQFMEKCVEASKLLTAPSSCSSR